MPFKHALALVFGVSAFFALAILAGAEDYANAKHEERSYCEHVADGSWPDYKGTFNEVCVDSLGK